MRYRYLAYKYSRQGRSATLYHSVWESVGSWPMQPSALWHPPTDVYETPDKILVLMDLAGVAEDRMAITLFSDLLVVEGTRDQPLNDINACHQLGIKYGDFRSEVDIHAPVDHDKTQADYTNGLLTITLSKRY